jgi:hypothetical protein
MCDERLAASRERIEKGYDRALVIGAGGIDDDVGRSRCWCENFRIVQRAQHRLDARARTASALSWERTRPVT